MKLEEHLLCTKEVPFNSSATKGISAARVFMDQCLRRYHQVHYRSKCWNLLIEAESLSLVAAEHM